MKKEPSTDSTLKIVAEYLRVILNILVSGYMLLIIMVMPFYYQEGYNHIGSDKSYFFRTYTTYAAKIILPVAAAFLACLAIDSVLQKKVKSKNSAKSSVSKGNTGTEKTPNAVVRVAAAVRQNLSITDLFALGYAVSVVISYLCTDYRATALWGTHGWYMGTIPQLMLVGIYFAVSRMWKRNNWMGYLFLLASAVVFFLGVANRFGWYPIPMESSELPGYISTIGNINWYCGYMVCTLFLGVGLFWTDKGERKWRTVLLAVYCVLGFCTAVTQGSDSGVFALAAAFLAIFVLSARDMGKMLRFWQLMTLFSGACGIICLLRRRFPEKMDLETPVGNLLTTGKLCFIMLIASLLMLGMTYLCRNRRIITVGYRVSAVMLCVLVPLAAVTLILMIFVNTKEPGSLGALSERSFFTFDGTWGSKRGATWISGWKCFADQGLLHKIVGVGPDCMADYIDNGGNLELVEYTQKMFGNARLTNAHGEWLTILVDCGLLGLTCFVGMIMSAIIRFWSSLRQRKALLNGASGSSGGSTENIHGIREAFAVACGLSLWAYTCNNIWSFQQSMSVATIFVILGLGEIFSRGKER